MSKVRKARRDNCASDSAGLVLSTAYLMSCGSRIQPSLECALPRPDCAYQDRSRSASETTYLGSVPAKNQE